MSVVIMVVTMILLLFVGVPVAFALGCSSLLTLLLDGGIPLEMLPQRLFNAVNSFSLLAIPFFMMAGSFMDEGGLTRKLVDFADAVAGWLKCGLCYVSVLAGMLMGGISGSCAADTAALSSLLIPAMEKKGYPKPFSAALQASGGAIGIIIPPSIPMIIIGGITGISVSKMFIGGILPGILIGVSLMLTARIICVRKGIGVNDLTEFAWANVWSSFKRAVLPLLAPVIIMGGIMGGYFTATEASVVATVYTFVVGAFVYRNIKAANIVGLLFDAGKKTAQVMLVVACSTVFSWLLSYYKVTRLLEQTVLQLTVNPLFVMLIMMFIFFVLAMFIDETPLVIMLMPIMLPIATKVGVNPLHFCVMIVINNAIGAIMPPVGTAMFVSSASCGVKVIDTAKQIMPFVLAYVICLLLVGVFPQIAIWLPSVIR